MIDREGYFRIVSGPNAYAYHHNVDQDTDGNRVEDDLACSVPIPTLQTLGQPGSLGKVSKTPVTEIVR